jgi:hypothetical protein
VLVDVIEIDGESFDAPWLPFPIPVVDLIGVAVCGAGCEEPPLVLPVDVRRKDSGWLPPLSFDEASRRWYVTQEHS